MLTLERPPLAVKLLKIFTETVCRSPGTPHIHKLRIPSVLAKSDPPVCPPLSSRAVVLVLLPRGSCRG